jgi:hypothetical protein
MGKQKTLCAHQLILERVKYDPVTEILTFIGVLRGRDTPIVFPPKVTYDPDESEMLLSQGS